MPISFTMPNLSDFTPTELIDARVIIDFAHVDSEIDMYNTDESRYTTTLCGVRITLPGQSKPSHTFSCLQAIDVLKNSEICMTYEDGNAISPYDAEAIEFVNFIRPLVLAAYEDPSKYTLKQDVTTNRGDILKSGADIIVQQVNARGFMGKGLALSINNAYPFVKPAYVDYVKSKSSEDDLMGRVLWVRQGDSPIFANIFGQADIRKNKDDINCYTSYPDLFKGLDTVLKNASRTNRTVAIPYGIGCGLAGGDWLTVSGMIQALTAKHQLFDVVAINQL